MRRLCLAVFLGGFVLLQSPSLEAHCVGDVPEVKMTYPEDGVAIQEAHYVDMGARFIDTFYRDSLKEQLLERYQENEYAIFAYIDSIHYFLALDSVFYQDEFDRVDTLRGEGLWITVHSQLKGPPIPGNRIYIVDSSLIYIPEQPLATSYTGLIDTPFVTFFNTYDNAFSMNFGPVDGCYFEPDAYFIIDGQIVKKGDEGIRMPGVSLAASEFLKAVGLENREIPQTRPGNTAIKIWPGGNSRWNLPATGARSVPTFDVKGRLRVLPRQLPGEGPSSSLHGLPAGIYFQFPEKKTGMSPDIRTRE